MTVHRNPQLIARAVSVLSSGNAGFFIHVDTKSQLGEFSFSARANVVIKQHIPVYWGEFSQVEATLLLLREALSDPLEYEYFVFLQGSDYPLRSGRYIEDFLEGHRGFEFINLRKMPAPGYPLAKINTIRYSSTAPIKRFIYRGLAKFGLAERDYRKSLSPLDAYAGQAYWTLSRQACRYILDFVDSTPQFNGYFRDAFTSDEMFFHTILGNSPFRERVLRSLMFVQPDWSIADERRHQITEAHVTSFERQQKVWVDDEWGSGEVLFVRKLSDLRLDLAQRIDEMIERREAKQHLA